MIRLAALLLGFAIGGGLVVACDTVKPRSEYGGLIYSCGYAPCGSKTASGAKW